MSTTKTKKAKTESKDSKTDETLTPDDVNVALVKADQALLSLRSSGHDYCSAVGEVFDNSIQANANNILLRMFTEKKVVGKNKRKTQVVDRMAIGDDGDGMSKPVLHKALQLGFSSRYNDRAGMGRFGVGAKLAGISLARRIEIYSREKAGDPWLMTYIDLDEIGQGAMQFIPEPFEGELPDDCKDLVGETGTLVVWAKTDRLAVRDSGGARQASKVTSDLMNYTARTFRKFLDGGIVIRIADKIVKPYDPLYLMTTTRFHDGDKPDPTATIVVDEEFEWDIPRDPERKAKVRVRMTLLPEEFRLKRGEGGSDDAKDRRINENEGISILRAGREIFFGYLPKVQPSIEKVYIDRFWGAEISFSPELDECFHVRNVKKGAEPLNGLRDKLAEYIFKTVGTLRSQIKATFQKTEATEQKEQGIHAEAEEVAAKTVAHSPKPKAGSEKSEEEKEEKIQDVVEKLTVDQPERRESVEEEVRSRPFTLLVEGWPGSEMFDIDHLGSQAIVKLNMRHPFYKEVYAPLVGQLESESDDIKSVARQAQVGLDLLILAFARAEGMRQDGTDYYADLRTQWGVHLKNMVQAWKN